MATFSGSYNFDMSVLANYTALMGDIFDQIVAMGLVQTADTGQTDPGGVGSLPAQNNYGNFAVFRTNDGLANLYFRIGFGRDGSNHPAMTFQLGTGTDGAGTLTGNTTSSKTGNAGVTTSGRSVYISGDTNRLTICLNPVATSRDQAFHLGFARSHDGTGADTAAEATLIWIYSGTNGGQHTIALSGTSGVEQTYLRAACPRPASGSTWDVGLGDGVAMVVPMGSSYGANPSLAAGLYRLGDLTPDTTTVISVYGSNHTYLVAGSDTVNDDGNGRPLFRYE